MRCDSRKFPISAYRDVLLTTCIALSASARVHPNASSHALLTMKCTGNGVDNEQMQDDTNSKPVPSSDAVVVEVSVVAIEFVFVGVEWTDVMPSWRFTLRATTEVDGSSSNCNISANIGHHRACNGCCTISCACSGAGGAVSDGQRSSKVKACSKCSFVGALADGREAVEFEDEDEDEIDEEEDENGEIVGSTFSGKGVCVRDCDCDSNGGGC